MLPERLREDGAFLRLLAASNMRLRDVEEARAILEGNPSREAEEIRTSARRQ